MKKTLCAILAITMLVLLCACNTPSPASDKKDNSKKEEVTEAEKSKEKEAASEEEKTEEAKSDEAKKEEVKSVKLATVASTEPRLQLCKEILAEKGIDVEIVLCEGNAGPATALMEGDVDGIIVNHLPWITAFNNANNTNLVMLQPYAYYCPTRMYSSKWKSVDEIPDNADIVVSNDPANLTIALTMLESAGLIKLGEKSGEYYSEADITENPKNIKLKLTDTIYVVSSYKDADAIICFAHYAINGDFDTTKFLYENPTDKSECPCGLIVNEDIKDADWAVYLAEQLATDKWINKSKEIYGLGAHGYYNE